MHTVKNDIHGLVMYAYSEELHTGTGSSEPLLHTNVIYMYLGTNISCHRTCMIWASSREYLPLGFPRPSETQSSLQSYRD